MKRINILDSQTAQLIAAGEIAENPASVVKELMENSIDAGARRIIVEINGGGIKLIKVSDNGHGIYRDDVINAFERHGTSKLTNSNDINKISSLGFRGEALASIGAVSKVELLTRSREENLGTHMCVKAGKYSEIHDAGCPYGTVVSVRDLFYNVPARMKFLKSEVAEGNKIAALIDKLALSHPEVFFKLVRDNKQILCTPGDGKISSTVYSVYGKEFFDGMVPVNYEFNGIKLEGYISKPEKCRIGRNMQSFFVNGRMVKCKLAITALEEAFKNSIMVGKKPYCVLYLKLSYELVDVNVHPSKIEVKFANEEDVSEAIYSGVKFALDQYNLKTCPLGKTKNNNSSSNNLDTDKVLKFSKELNSINYNHLGNKSESIKNLVCSEPKGCLNISHLNGEYKSQDAPLYENFELKIKKHNPIEKYNSSEVIKQSKISIDFNLNEIKLIGEAFSCYIILQQKESLILIDKHAAHERIIFENLKNQNYKRNSQMLLNPLSIVLDKREYSAVIESLDLFYKAGYEILDGGGDGSGKIKVKSMPMYEELDGLENSVIEIANYLVENRKNTNPKKLEWLYHNIACKGAIKAGKKTSKDEILNLVKILLDNPNLKYCPHGRPIYLEFSKKFIEQQFKRI